MGKLALKLTPIASLADRELGQAWREAYACEPPALPADLLRLGIAYAVQEQAGGRLAARHRKALEPGARGSATPALAPGTQLVREWQGRTIRVVVTENGFEWDGAPHRSLSSIARKVTGTAWSGPRFFGVRDGD